MAQGKRKLKKLPIKQKQKHQKKALGLKKGAFNIATKKANKVDLAHMQKTFTKLLNAKNERQITLKAQSQEAKEFTIAKPTDKKKNDANKT